MTHQERIARWLMAFGAVEVKPSGSTKYRQFRSRIGGTYWLGSQGAVRKGSYVTKSVSLTARVWELVAEWEKDGCKEPMRKAE